jgi:inorganic triphosphatase YgiF
MQRDLFPVLREIELKLSVEPRHAARIWKTPVAAAYGNAKPVSRKLYSAYYDTADFAFRRHGAAVRLRRESGRWAQTIKLDSGGAAGLHDRAEFETPMPAQMLDFAALVEAGLGEIISDSSVRSAIEVVFTTVFRRRRTIVETGPGNRIELAVDRGEIVAGARRLPICEIELELKSGETSSLFRIARELAEEIPLRLDSESKAERGYRLASGHAEAPVKAAAPAFDKSMNVDAAFKALAASCLRHLQANERGVLKSRDPEYLHQARVALRRLRCAFGLFSRAVPRTFFDSQIADLRQIARSLGEARDLDVFLGQTLPAAGRGIPADELSGITRPAAAAARKARASARVTLGARAYTLLMLDLAEALSTMAWQTARDEQQARCAGMPLTAFCAQVLSRRDRQARKCANRAGHGDLEALHQLRIEIKKLRYACEFFSSLYPGRKARQYLQRLAALQEVLGSINDSAVAVQLLQDLPTRKAGARSSTATGYLRGYLAAQTELQLENLERAWARFERARPFW